MNPLFPLAIISSFNNNINQTNINTIRRPLPAPVIVMPQLQSKSYNPYKEVFKDLNTKKLNLYNKENQNNINYKKTK